MNCAYDVPRQSRGLVSTHSPDGRKASVIAIPQRTESLLYALVLPVTSDHAE